MPSDVLTDEVLALCEALQRLEKLEPRQARVVECRFFGGLNIDETAEALGLPKGTVKSRLSRALGRLREQLATSDGEALRG